MRFLITAGGTREYIDPVRYISNASSGRMGHAIAQAAVNKGHDVTLISTAGHLAVAESVKVIYVESAAEMFEAVMENFDGCDILVMAAAVADYTPAGPSPTKIRKSGDELTVRLIPTRDILLWAADHRQQGQLLVGFALEDIDIKARAEQKMAEKNLDMIVANTPEAISAEQSQVQILTRKGKWQQWPIADKSVTAEKIVSQIERQVDYI